MEPMKAAPRELTRHERATIRKLVAGMCANYDPDFGCLPLDYGGCYMLDKWWTGSYCLYFQNAVLPLDPALEVALTSSGAKADIRKCPVCNAAFSQAGKQAYCSEACAEAARRKRQRDYMRQRRGLPLAFGP